MWPDTVKQSGTGGTLTPADRHGSVQVSLSSYPSKYRDVDPDERIRPLFQTRPHLHPSPRNPETRKTFLSLSKKLSNLPKQMVSYTKLSKFRVFFFILKLSSIRFFFNPVYSVQFVFSRNISTREIIRFWSVIVIIFFNFGLPQHVTSISFFLFIFSQTTNHSRFVY